MSQNIQVGSRVTIAIDGEEREFVVVQDAGATNGNEAATITAGSQIGKALLGKGAGETVEIIVEGKPKLYRVIAVQ